MQCDDPTMIGRAARRLPCCVPHCKRTRGDRARDPMPADLTGYAWICERHWRQVPASVKAYRQTCNRRERIVRKGWWAASHSRAYTAADHDRWRAAHDRALRRKEAGWVACITAAIEAAAGI